MNKKVLWGLGVLAILVNFSYANASFETQSAVDSNDLSGSTSKARTLTAVSIDHSSSPYSVTTPDLVYADSSGGDIIIDLPAASSNTGKTYIFKKFSSDTNLITITPNGAETIDGEATFTLVGENESVEIVSNSTDWKVIQFSPTAIYRANSSSFPLSTSGYASFEYAQMTGNSLTLPPGRWELTGSMTYLTGGSAATTYLAANFYEANGNNSPSVPTALGTSAFTLVSDSGGLAAVEMTGNINIVSLAMPPRIVQNSSSATVYLVSRVGFSAPGTAATAARITARRIN